MCLEAGQVHAIGDTITVTLYTGAEQTLVLRGVVAYVLEADGYWRLGVEFDEVNQAAMDALALYLAA
jgi:hypothetical protein